MKSSDTLTGWRERRIPPLTIETLGPGALLGGSYRLLSHIGSGGMGEVFLAAHERLPMKLVVKVLSPTLISTRAIAQFGREAAVLAKLQHPNIVQLVDFNWTDSGLPFLVMEHLPGHDLEAGLEGHREKGLAACLAVLQQVASGLYAAHCRGIVHGDLKPKNIMVVPCDGRRDIVKLIDFGVSIVEKARVESGHQALAGTPEFMSPEQVLGRAADVGPGSDQFSLAVIAYLLIVGRLPWTASAPSALLQQVIRNRPSPLPRSMASVETVLLRAMAKQPERRYPSTLAFVRALRRAMLADGILAGRFAATRAERDTDEASPPPPTDLEDGVEHASTATTWNLTSSTVTFDDRGSPHPDAAVADANLPELSLDDHPPTVRLRRTARRHRPWRWAPILIGALLGGAFGLAGPLLAGDTPTSFWKTVHVRASQAATLVIDGSRQVLGHLSSRSWK